MQASLWSVTCGFIALVAGCSSAFNSGSGGSGTTGSSSSSSSGASSSGAGGSSTTTTTRSTTTTKSTTTTASTTTITATTTTGCPSEAGAYTMSVSGAGCGDLDPSAKECIQITGNVCQYEIATTGLGASGTVSVDPAGGFASGAITLGTANRTGCTGVWKPAISSQSPATLTIDCGGVGSSQSCIVTLTRDGDVCQ